MTGADIPPPLGGLPLDGGCVGAVGVELVESVEACQVGEEAFVGPGGVVGEVGE